VQACNSQSVKFRPNGAKSADYDKNGLYDIEIALQSCTQNLIFPSFLKYF